MSKYPTYPTLYDDVLQINITRLIKWGYIIPEHIIEGELVCRNNQDQLDSVFIYVNTIEEPYIELEYEFDGETRNYTIQLVSISSNLGLGEIWYFICPETNKQCRKLYFINGYFYHREAFEGCMYKCQTKSKSYRDSIFTTFSMSYKCYNEVSKKHFKHSYAGKPTKKYLRLRKQVYQVMDRLKE
ncbi:MAG: hypothetical protein JEZ03_17825 [Bacteroidales bacterium]|nr:hypothetical protein [Bacteroidales bacterium]